MACTAGEIAAFDGLVIGCDILRGGLEIKETAIYYQTEFFLLQNYTAFGYYNLESGSLSGPD